MKSARPGVFVYLSVVLVSLLLIAGCGGLSSRTSSAPPTPTPSPMPTPASSAKFVYSIVGPKVAGFTVQPDGKLQAIPGLSSAQQLNNTQLIATADGRWLFSITGCLPLGCLGGGAVFSQSIHSDGSLGTPALVIPVDQKIVSLVVDQSSHFAYALSDVVRVPPIDPDTGCSTISQMLTAYAIGTDGGLAPLNSNVATVNTVDCPAASGGFPITTLVGFHQDATGNFLWLTKTDPGRGSATPSLTSIPVAANGTLGTLTETAIQQFTQTEHSAIAGQFLVTNENKFREFIAPNTVTTFRLQNGNFQFASQCSTDVPACHGVLAIAVSSSGKVVYTVSGAGDSIGGFEPPMTVNALTVDASTGALVPFGKSIVLPKGAIFLPDPTLLPALATVDSQGSFLFISRNGDATITTIALDPTTGELGTSVDSAVGALPNAIVSVTK